MENRLRMSAALIKHACVCGAQAPWRDGGHKRSFVGRHIYCSAVSLFDVLPMSGHHPCKDRCSLLMSSSIGILDVWSVRESHVHLEASQICLCKYR